MFQYEHGLQVIRSIRMVISIRKHTIFLIFFAKLITKTHLTLADVWFFSCVYILFSLIVNVVVRKFALKSVTCIYVKLLVIRNSDTMYYGYFGCYTAENKDQTMNHGINFFFTYSSGRQST